MLKRLDFRSHFKKRAARYGLFIGIILILGGAGIIIPSVYYQSKSSLANIAPIEIPVSLIPAETDRTIISGNPVRIHVPSVNIDIPIVDGIYNESSNTWNVSNDSAHFAKITTLPNDYTGNTFIYGHLRPSVFYRLPKTVVGDEAIVYTDNDLAFHYKLEKISETNPQDVSALLSNQDSGPVLTLQTCSGIWYQNRQIFSFRFDKLIDNSTKLSSIK